MTSPFQIEKERERSEIVGQIEVYEYFFFKWYKICDPNENILSLIYIHTQVLTFFTHCWLEKVENMWLNSVVRLQKCRFSP